MKRGWVVALAILAASVGASGMEGTRVRRYGGAVEQVMQPWASATEPPSIGMCTVGLEPRSFPDEVRAEFQAMAEVRPRLQLVRPVPRLAQEHRQLLRAVDAHMRALESPTLDLMTVAESRNRVYQAARKVGATFRPRDPLAWIVDWTS